MMRTSRRHFLKTSTVAATAAYLGPRGLFAQATASPATDRAGQMRAAAVKAKITTQPLRGNISVLMGSGGNIAVLPGGDGKLLVDSGFSTARPQVSEALTGISADPVKRLINTHWHFDHTDGNEWMHSAGATILAHKNTRKRMSAPQTMVDLGMSLPASPAGALPTEWMQATRTLQANSETLHLSHFDPAHTDGDISVHFANADVFHAGDTWFNGLYPFIDYSSGGNIDGMIKAADRILATTSAATILIPGHGPVGNREQFQQFHDMLTGTREKVAVLKKQGRTLEEVVAAKPTAVYDEHFKAATGSTDFYIKLVYEGV